MNHSDVMRLMPDYLEGDLPLDRRALFDAHLDECAGCAREIAEMRWAIGALRAMPEPEPPPGLVEGVMSQIRLAGEPRASRLDALRATLSRLIEPRILAPISAALLVAGVLLGTQPLRDLLEPATGSLDAGAIASRPGESDAAARAVGTEVAAAERRALKELLSSQESRTVQAGVGQPGGNAPAAPSPGQLARSEQRTEHLFGGPAFQLGRYVLVRPEAEPAPSLTVTSQRGADDFGTPSFARPPHVPFPLVASDAIGSRLPTADEWLEHLERSPAEFADQLAARSLAEREHWIDSLSRRAVDEGRLERALTALRATRSPTALSLADEFAAAGARYGGTQSASSGAD